MHGTVGDVTKDWGPEDGDVIIRPFVKHEWMRADRLKPKDQQDAGDVEFMVWDEPGSSIPVV